MTPATGDTSTPKVSIVLPAHNELSLLGSTVTNLVTGLEDRRLSYEILVVENGSSDGTLELSRLLEADQPHLRVLSLPRGDYGEALASGFSEARGEVVVNFDVDYYDLAFLDAALGLLADGGCGLVLASKRAPGSADRRPLLRRLLTAGFTALLRWAVALEVTDAHGMKALDREQLAPVVERCVLRGSVFDVEMVARATRAGVVAREVPAVVVERRPPRTSIVGRSVESGLGVLRLRKLLESEEGPAVQRPTTNR